MTPLPSTTPVPAAVFGLPFSFPKLVIPAALGRFKSVSARALAAHELPESANRVLGEALVLTAMLGSSLKLDGRLTLQTKSSGPLDLLTVDYYGAGDTHGQAGLRAFARVNEPGIAALGDE